MNCVSPSFFLHVFFHLFFYIWIYISVRMKKTYSEADIDAAVELFQTTDNSLSQCAKIHGLPRMTLSDRIKGKHKSTMGAPTKLGLTCEQSLVAILVLLASIGFGLGRFELQAVVNNYSCRKKEKKN